MSACENRSGRTDIDSIAGSVHTVPAHATVSRFERPSWAQLTSTAGSGFSIVPAFQRSFIVGYPYLILASVPLTLWLQ